MQPNERLLEEQELIREALGHPGVRMLFEKLEAVAVEMERKQLECDPFTESGRSAIKRSQEFRYVARVMFPQIIEGLVNYDPEAPDKQVEPKKRWSMSEWLKK